MTSLPKADRSEVCEALQGETTLTVTVQTPSARFDFPCSPGEALLHAGLRSGITLPYECATGTCGSCRGRLTKGEIDIGWEASPALSKLKREKGDILLCQARATSDCHVRVTAKVTRTGDEKAPRRFAGTVCDSRQLTRDVIEFGVKLSSPMGFEAGQFALIESPSVIGARAYSMVNYEQQSDKIVFVVKRKRGGGFCEWLFSGPIDGAKVDVFGPLGRATFDATEEKNLIIVAGGSGIAGMMSILEHATLSGHFKRHRGYVFFGVPTSQDGFYLDELAKYVTDAEGHLEVTLALSDETALMARHPKYQGIKLGQGFVHAAMAKSMSGRYQNALAYLAGPPPMVDGALRTLISEGQLPAQAIRYDKFG